MIKSLLSDFQNTNKEKFNEELIYMRNEENDNMLQFFTNLFSSLGVPNITFKECKIIHDEFEQRQYTGSIKSQSIEESRLDLIVADFVLEIDGESKEYRFLQYFPKIRDDFFFDIIGNRYFSIYQISDKTFYATSKAVYLKTLLMPLGLKFDNGSFKSMGGRTIKGLELKLDIFRQKSINDVKNLFLFYLIEYQENALDYLLNYKEDNLGFFSEVYEEIEGYDAYQIKKDFYFYFSTKYLDKPEYVNLIVTIALSLKGTRKTPSTLFTDLNYLKKRIISSTNPNVAKADKAIISLKRILDEVTKGTIDLPYEEKENTFAIARYMAWNFNELMRLDTVDLRNRRLRLFEYMVYPLLARFSNSTYRILNSRILDMRKLEGMFSAISINFIVKSLVANELLRYHNSTSTLELFNVALKFSARGPQTLGSNGSGITMKYRGIHPSYVGTVGLTMASASDPGITGVLTPLTKNVKNLSFQFVE